MPSADPRRAALHERGRERDITGGSSSNGKPPVFLFVLVALSKLREATLAFSVGVVLPRWEGHWRELHEWEAVAPCPRWHIIMNVDTVAMTERDELFRHDSVRGGGVGGPGESESGSSESRRGLHGQCPSMGQDDFTHKNMLVTFSLQRPNMVGACKPVLAQMFRSRAYSRQQGKGEHDVIPFDRVRPVPYPSPLLHS